MSSAQAIARGLVSKGFQDQGAGHVAAGARKTVAASMFKSPDVYRRSAVVVSSDVTAAPPSSQPRATTLHSFDLTFGASPSGSFGIGITLEKVGHGPNMGLPIIKEVLPNGSAFAKLACGDVLLSIGGKAIDKNAPLKSTMQAIKGAGDTFVDVTILRFHPVQSQDETLTFRLKRQPLQNLSPFVKRTATLPTTFSSSSQSSFIGVRTFCPTSTNPSAPGPSLASLCLDVALQVNLLTPRIDYPPDPPVQKPSNTSHVFHKQQLPERHQKLAQSHSPHRQHLPSAAHSSTGSADTNTQEQLMLDLQRNQALLEMNRITLLPHQQEELLRLQLQLNHLQQLSLQQQMKNQEIQQDASCLSPISPSAKHNASARFHVLQPKPWPLPPPRVVSTEPDTSTALSPRIADASSKPPHASTTPSKVGGPSPSELESTRIEAADQSCNVSASSEAIDQASITTSLQQPTHAFDELESESNVHPSVVNATDAPRNHAGGNVPHTAVDSHASPHPRGPVNRLLPPGHLYPADGSHNSVELHSPPPQLNLSDSRPILNHSPLGSSVEEQITDATSRSPDAYFTPKQLDPERRFQRNVQARLGFASGATPAVTSLTSEQELRSALAATQVELADARRSLRYCMTELVRSRCGNHRLDESDASAASQSNQDAMHLEHRRLDPTLEVNLGFTPARKSVIASVSSPSPHTFQTVSVGENSAAPRPLSHQPQTSALNESVGGLTGDVLKQSGGAATEMLLLNSEIVHLRQRLHMEVLSNQELEEMIEFTLELLSRLSPDGSDSLNRSSALEAYDCIKRTLQDRLFARQQRILALYKTQLV